MATKNVLLDFQPPRGKFEKEPFFQKVLFSSFFIRLRIYTFV